MSAGMRSGPVLLGLTSSVSLMFTLGHNSIGRMAGAELTPSGDVMVLEEEEEEEEGKREEEDNQKTQVILHLHPDLHG